AHAPRPATAPVPATVASSALRSGAVQRPWAVPYAAPLAPIDPWGDHEARDPLAQLAAVLHAPAARGGGGTRAPGAHPRLPAVRDRHHLAPAGHVVRRGPAREGRRDHPADRGDPHVLRHRRGPPVRD